jgi:hypothetical protein
MPASDSNPNQHGAEKDMKKSILFLLVALILAAGAILGGRASQAAADDLKILEFDTMIGVPRPYTGSANAIRGVSGGGLPWVIAQGAGELTAGGGLEVEVQGLVFDPNDQAVIDAGLAGRNTVPNFRAIVSCLSKDAEGNATVVNVPTGLFPADAGGNAKIEASVDLPEPCIAPIIFVTSPGNAWFAATGQ